jgi:hypothetical protein
MNELISLKSKHGYNTKETSFNPGLLSKMPKAHIVGLPYKVIAKEEGKKKRM